MLTIELIETKLKIMNPDAFHRLCDHFLFFEGDDEFDSIVPVGQVEGKQKAKKGTPAPPLSVVSKLRATMPGDSVSTICQ